MSGGTGAPTQAHPGVLACSGCGVSWARCVGLRAGRCCPRCLDRHGDTHRGPHDDPPTEVLPTRPVAPSDPANDPPFYAAVAREQGATPRPSPTPRQQPSLEPVPDPPIYAELAAELLIDPLPPTYARGTTR